MHCPLTLLNQINQLIKQIISINSTNLLHINVIYINFNEGEYSLFHKMILK